jgi:20S proteasome subunit alpha 6
MNAGMNRGPAGVGMGMAGGGGNMNMTNNMPIPMQARPPVRPNQGRASIPIRPVIPHAMVRPPRPHPPSSTPRGPSSAGVPVVRPPIRLGLGGPPPLGLPRIPRGPSVMRRGGVGEGDRKRRDRERERERDRDREREKREREKEREREMKTTMTDFRIVGIEVVEEGWKWGLTGDDVDKEEVLVDGDEKAAAGQEGEVEVEVKIEKDVAVKQEEDVDGEKPKDIGGVVEDEKHEETEEDAAESAESVEAKRGEKRKAKTPEGGSFFPFLDSFVILTINFLYRPPLPSYTITSVLQLNLSNIRRRILIQKTS